LEVHPRLSPDGRWLAYEARDEEGLTKVYVVPFPDSERARWEISPQGGHQPVWSKSSQELFYVDNELRIVAVAYRTSPTFELLSDSVLAPRSGANIWRAVYDVSGDGERMLVLSQAPDDESQSEPSWVLVRNFFEEVRERVGR
jgi:Tol biopolymer transport system component